MWNFKDYKKIRHIAKFEMINAVFDVYIEKYYDHISILTIPERKISPSISSEDITIETRYNFYSNKISYSVESEKNKEREILKSWEYEPKYDKTIETSNDISPEDSVMLVFVVKCLTQIILDVNTLGNLKTIINKLNVLYEKGKLE